jgi:hypothetical protein
MAAYADISYSGMFEVILEAAKERYSIRIAEKNENFRKIPESSRRSSPAEYADELEQEIEANNSMDSENNKRKEVFFLILLKYYRLLRAHKFEMHRRL